MKIIATKENLLKAIHPLRKVLSQTTREGFRENILILNIGKDIFFHAFSDDICLTSKISFEEEIDPFKIVVNLDKLLRFISSCEEESTINLNIATSRVTVSCNKAKIVLHKRDPESFPNLPSPRKDNEVLVDTYLSCGALLEGILITETALPATDGIHRDYECILFDPSEEEGFIRLVATKGTFLAMHKVPGVLSSRFKLRATSISAVKEVLKQNLDKDCELINGDSYSYIKIDNVLISIRNLDDKYADYLKLFSSNYATSIEISTESITSMVTRARLIEDRAGFIRLEVKVKSDRLEIEGSTTQGSFSEEIEYTGDPVPAGCETIFAVNAYLFALTAKAARADYIKMSFLNPNSPILVQSGNKNTVCLLMPLKQ